MVSEERDLEEAFRGRRLFIELLITTLVFGVTLNLVSDFISIFFEGYLGLIALFSGILTVAALMFMFRILIKDIPHFRRKLILSLLWDKESGEIAKRETGYLPQIILNSVAGNLKEGEQARVAELLRQDIQTIRVGGTPALQMLIECTLFNVLDRLASISNTSELISISQFYRYENQMLTRPLDSMRMPVFSGANVKYRRGNSNMCELEMKWKKGVLGALKLQFALKKVDAFEIRPDSEIAIVDPFELDEFADAVTRIAEMYPKILPEIFPERKLELPRTNVTSSTVRADVEMVMEYKFRPSVFYVTPRRIETIDKWVQSFGDSIAGLIDWQSYSTRVRGMLQARSFAKSHGFG